MKKVCKMCGCNLVLISAGVLLLLSASVAPAWAQPKPKVSIDLNVPIDPIKVPAGESFKYSCNLTNHLRENQTVDVWMMLEYPNGKMYGPVYKDDFTLKPGELNSST
jgi:hypothetical protein